MGNGAGKQLKTVRSAQKLQGFMGDMLSYYHDEIGVSPAHGDGADGAGTPTASLTSSGTGGSQVVASSSGSRESFRKEAELASHSPSPTKSTDASPSGHAQSNQHSGQRTPSAGSRRVESRNNNEEKTASHIRIVPSVVFDLHELKKPEGMWSACSWLISHAPRELLTNFFRRDEGLDVVLQRIFFVLDADTGAYNKFNGRPKASLDTVAELAPQVVAEEKHVVDVLHAAARHCLFNRSVLNPGKKFKLPTQGAAATFCKVSQLDFCLSAHTICIVPCANF